MEPKECLQGQIVCFSMIPYDPVDYSIYTRPMGVEDVFEVGSCFLRLVCHRIEVK